SLSCLTSFCVPHRLFLFFLHAPATSEIYTLSLHDALPIWPRRCGDDRPRRDARCRHLRRSGTGSEGRRQRTAAGTRGGRGGRLRSEEHTSELQSRENLVCRLLLEKKK